MQRERDWQGYLENLVYELGRNSRNVFRNKKRKNLEFDTQRSLCGDRNEGECWSSRSSWRACTQSERASSGQIRQKASKRGIGEHVGERRILYQDDPRHVDVVVESLGLENGNTVQTPTVDDMKDESPVWLDPEQTSK